MADKTPSPAISKRLKDCRQAMKGAGLPALLVTNRFDHVYLTGFTGEDSAVLITKNGVHVISDGRFDVSIGREVPWARVSIRKGQLIDEIVKVIGRSRLKKVGIQSEYMTVGMRNDLAGKLAGVKLVESPPILGDMRTLKTRPEMKKLEKAVRIAEDAFQATLKTIRIGQTELELAGRLEYEMKRRGSTSPSFDTIVAVNGNAALPHAVPGRSKVKRGCLILFDWGATYDFYRSDLTRTVFIGSIPPQMRDVYEIVLAAQEKAIAAIKPGMRMCDVDAVAREYIAAAGYGEEFNHGLGHGLGLDVHEAPSLSYRSDEKLRAGMVVTVEPGVYLPGIGGVRIEDDVLVTSKGPRVLSHLRKTLKTAVQPAKA